MKTVFTIALTMLMLAFSGLVHAVKIYECEDEAGNRSFDSNCPPGSTIVGEKKFNLVKEPEASPISATMYLVPNCGACDQVREFFMLRKIALTEKNVDNNVELQKELTEKAGELKVPTVVINDTVISGYDRVKMISTLEAAGYSDTVPAPPLSTPAETTSQPDTVAEQPVE
jgi:glutaredoxin